MSYRLLYVTIMAAMFTSTVVNSSSVVAGEASKTSIRPPISSPMLYATGEGAVANAKEQPNRAKAYLEAKSYAKMQAIASVVQVAKGTIIEYTSRGNNYVAETLIKQQINGVLDSVQVVAVSKRSIAKDMIVAVTVRAPKPVPPKPVKVREPKQSASVILPAFVPTWLFGTNGGKGHLKSDVAYTSVIIDAQGMGLSRSMSPRILRPDNSEVWGTVETEYDFISEYGIVAYAKSRAEAYASKRAGEHPLLIRATAKGPSRSNGDVVISQIDSGYLEEANQKSRFLEDFRVIMIVD